MRKQLKKNEKVQAGLLSLACVIIVLGILFLVNAMQEDPANGFFPAFCEMDNIIAKYIIPNSMAPLIVQGSVGVASAILSIASLSFVGLGVQPPTPEWGAMLSNARTYMRDAWHITVMPGAAIMLSILSLNIIGDGLRDALDPRLKN